MIVDKTKHLINIVQFDNNINNIMPGIRAHEPRGLNTIKLKNSREKKK
jgi:hypothetical protein